MNFVWIMGHLGADAEVRYTSDGRKVVTLRVAVNEKRKGKEETIWYRVTIWGERYDKMLPYLTKGSGVVVGGTMHKPEIYTDRNGNQQISLEITAEHLSFNPFGRSDRSQQNQPAQQHGSFGMTAPQSPAPFGGYGDAEYGGSDYEEEFKHHSPSREGNEMPF